jgi:hypothetical protein
VDVCVAKYLSKIGSDTLRATLEPIRSFLNATKNRNSGISIAILAALLVVACSSGPRGNKTMPPGIHVELDPDKPLTLKVAVRSGSLLPATFDKNRLPWATSYSMILVAARQPDGRVLEATSDRGHHLQADPFVASRDVGWADRLEEMFSR